MVSSQLVESRKKTENDSLKAVGNSTPCSKIGRSPASNPTERPSGLARRIPLATGSAGNRLSFRPIGRWFRSVQGRPVNRRSSSSTLAAVRSKHRRSPKSGGGAAFGRGRWQCTRRRGRGRRGASWSNFFQRKQTGCRQRVELSESRRILTKRGGSSTGLSAILSARI